jgi:methionyl aminopeptidase
MEAGEVYALETFPSTGNGRGEEQNECSHYQVNTDMLVEEYRALKGIKGEGKNKKFQSPILDRKETYVYQRILDLYQTLPFCKKWLQQEKVNKYQVPLRNLVKKNRIKAFPPLSDIKGSYVAQSEKTVFVGESGVKVLN